MPTLHEALLTFLQVDRSPATNRQYHMVLSKLVTAVGPQRSISLIRYEDLVDYFARLRATGIEASTQFGYLSVTKAFFNWCVECAYIEASPAAKVKVRKSRKKAQRSPAVPPEELKAMVEVARATSPRNHALLLFLIDTGCRVGGLVSLTLANLHLEDGWALLLEKGQKEHRALFGEQTAAALEKWLSRRPLVSHDYVWTGRRPASKPLTASGAGDVIRRLAAYAECSQEWGPHAIRHATGEAYAKLGLPLTVVQAKLGHEDPSITARYYFPNDEAYLVATSRRYPLAALGIEENDGREPVRIVKGGKKRLG